MITFKNGDLMDFTEDAFGHGCNCQKTMGAGVARAVKEKYPELYKADLEFPFPAKERLGKYSRAILKKSNISLFQQVGYNIYTQLNFFPRGVCHLNYVALHMALVDICADIKERMDATLALPRIGAGLAGGDWNKILPIIENASKESGIDITIYSL